MALCTQYALIDCFAALRTLTVVLRPSNNRLERTGWGLFAFLALLVCSIVHDYPFPPAAHPCRSTNRASADSKRAQRGSCRADIQSAHSILCIEPVPYIRKGAAQSLPPLRSGTCPSIRLCLRVPSSNPTAQTTRLPPRVWPSVFDAPLKCRSMARFQAAFAHDSQRIFVPSKVVCSDASKIDTVCPQSSHRTMRWRQPLFAVAVVFSVVLFWALTAVPHLPC